MPERVTIDIEMQPAACGATAQNHAHGTVALDRSIRGTCTELAADGG